MIKSILVMPVSIPEKEFRVHFKNSLYKDKENMLNKFSSLFIENHIRIDIEKKLKRCFLFIISMQNGEGVKFKNNHARREITIIDGPMKGAVFSFNKRSFNVDRRGIYFRAEHFINNYWLFNYAFFKESDIVFIMWIKVDILIETMGGNEVKGGVVFFI